MKNALRGKKTNMFLTPSSERWKRRVLDCAKVTDGKKGTRLCTRVKKTCSGKLEKHIAAFPFKKLAVLRMVQLLRVDNIELPR